MLRRVSRALDPPLYADARIPGRLRHVPKYVRRVIRLAHTGSPRLSLFADRSDAGRRLAEKLGACAGRDDLVVLALPRGGVPVAYEIAAALGAPLDVLVVRKLGAPGQPELAMGAIASGGLRILNDDVVRGLAVPEETIERVAAAERRELARRERACRGGAHEPLDVRGRTAIVVDDGLATGATMHAAVRALRQREPARIVVAVPTAAADGVERLRAEADRVVCLATPEPYIAVGVWYRDFRQTTDEEVRRLLDASRRAGAAGPSAC